MNLTAISSILSQLDPEVWLLTARAGPRRGGLAATSVCPVSIVPEMPRLFVSIARQHHTWELVEASGAFALHLIGEEHADWVWRFGLESGRDVDKLAGLKVRDGQSGSPILEEALAWLDCRVEARLDVGDRTIYLAEVLDGAQTRLAPPLRMQRLLQIAPPEKLQMLKERRARQGEVDAEAIRAWRIRGK